MAKEDVITTLINETKERLKDEKMIGLAAGAVIGYVLGNKIQDQKVRDAIVGAIGGETLGRLLGEGKEKK